MNHDEQLACWCSCRRRRGRGGTRNICYRTMGVRSHQLRCVPPDQGRTLGQHDRTGTAPEAAAQRWRGLQWKGKGREVGGCGCAVVCVLLPWNRSARGLLRGMCKYCAWGMPVCAQNRATIARTLRAHPNQDVYLRLGAGETQRERAAQWIPARCKERAQLLQAS
jgi:hypothetical protein